MTGSPPRCFDGIIRGEVTRIWRACDSLQDRRRHIDFFIQRFADRGHDASRIRRVAANALLKLSRPIALRKSTEHASARFFFVARYRACFPQRAVSKALNKHRALLPGPLQHSKLGIAFTVGKCQFRRDYRRNFHTPRQGGVGRV